VRRWLLMAACVVVGLAAGALAAATSPLLALAVPVALVGGLVLLSDLQMSLLALIGVAYLLPSAAIPLKLGFNPTLLDVVLLAFFFVWLVRLATDPAEVGAKHSLVHDAPVTYEPANASEAPSCLTSRNGGRDGESGHDGESGRDGESGHDGASSPLLNGLVLVFIGLACTSFFLSTGVTQDILRRFAEIVLVLFFYFGVVNTVRTRQLLERLVAAIILAAAAAAIIGLVLYFLPHDLANRLLNTLRVLNYPTGWVLRFINNDPAQAQRAIATSVDPNVLGGVLAMAAALTTGQLFSPRPVLRRALLLPAWGVMLLCLLLTYSRGSWVGLAAGLVLIATLKERRLWVLFLTLGVAVLFLPQAEAFLGHLSAGVQIQDRATQMRLGEYKDAFKLIAQFPWFGIGFAAAPVIDLYRGVSSVYLLIAEEMGLLGLGAYLAIMAVFFWQGLHGLGRLADEGLRSILVGLLAAVLSALVAGVLDHHFLDINFPHVAALFWLNVGLTAVTVRMSDS
jgi:O-antigen ligase